ncbi:oligosaccharide flippase family protein [Marinimicrobium locisalis]|uniref:oligosaccharide flippase family protein n=1 Tax=Marinimicrobium locisalis TaxID=546022 RepID=UPI0032219C9F
MAPLRTGKKQAAQHIAIYSVGSIVRQLAGFIMLPIYTSYLSPADYGVVSLLIVMIALFELVIGARFAQAVPKFYYEKEDEQHRSSVISTALLVTGFVSLISTLVVALNSELIARILFGDKSYNIHVALYGTLLFTSALEAYGLTFFRLKEKPFIFIANSISKLVLQLSLNILFVVYLNKGVIGVIWSALLASSVMASVAACYILYNSGIKYKGNLVKRLFKFSWPLWLAGIAGLYVASSNRYFIRIFSDLDQVGLFELAAKFSTILPLLIWNPFSQWWQTERFKLYQSEDKGVTVFPLVFDGITTIMVLVATGIALFSGPVISIMASPPFHPAATAVPILVFGVLISNLRFFFFFSFLVTERTIVITYIKYASALIATVLYLVLIPKLGFLGAASSILATEIFVLLVSFFLSKKYFDNGIKLYYAATLIVAGIGITLVDHFLWGLEHSIWKMLAGKTLLAFVLVVFLAVSVFLNTKLKNSLIDFKDEIKGKYIKTNL